MCFGGGSAGTITKPDYNAYDKQFQLQKDAIESQMDNQSKAMQGQLNASLKQQTAIREKIRDAQVQKAKDQDKLEEEARRLSVLVGTPPPEPTAQAPVIGARDRRISSRKGKSSLRIGKKVASSSGQGTGLNITSP